MSRADDEDSLFRTLFEPLPCAAVVLDRSQRVRAVNQVLAEGLALPESALVGLSRAELFACDQLARRGPARCETCASRDATSNTACPGCPALRRVGGTESPPFVLSGERYTVVYLPDVGALRGARGGGVPARPEAPHGIVGDSTAMARVHEAIRDFGPVALPVLVQGESGTGKELVARALHAASPRAAGPFVALNCGALPEGLVQSELFGHVRGAFTGAVRDAKGRFELADGGTLFLDEVGELPPTTQARLLRVLQTGTFERVGSGTPVHADVRVVAASNRELHAEVAAGRFRLDLYYRLAAVTIALPPLRERRDDLPALARHILEAIAREMGGEPGPLTRGALDRLAAYEWPGNVRELENVLRYAAVKAHGRPIEPDHLALAAGAPVALRPPSPRRGGRPRKLAGAEVENALRHARGNKVRAAALLGVSRATLYRFIDDSAL